MVFIDAFKRWTGFGAAYSSPYRDQISKDTGPSWQPHNYSTDAGILSSKSHTESRIKDLIKRDGLLAGAVDSTCSMIVGDGLRLSLRPD